MGNAPSQEDREEEDMAKGVALSKTNTGEIRITEGFVEQLEEQSRSDEGGSLYLQGRQLEKVSAIVKAAKEKGREEMKSEIQEEISELKENLSKEIQANSDLKNTSLPIINDLSDTVCSKLAPKAELKPILCAKLMNDVLECSRNNPNRTLYCTSLVDSYVDCVKSHRQQLVHPPVIH
ncbi:hypothetical protein LOD99_4613 [Oopsacas minuta]|uniref:Uncharacterized protein n=1 Tax=Oopsacas minuta TaxID=111878 RepID=A0AAV7JT38_9METZ|nr:hypothetical protein LOD99_4613 [Oopsacas minuta]